MDWAGFWTVTHGGPMKAFRIIACILFAVLLSACAAQAPQTVPFSEASSAHQYMKQTEKNAESAMVTVYWVNPPKSHDLDAEAEKDGS